MKRAAAKTFASLDGAYAIALIVDGNENEIIVARQGSPLAIGHGDGEMYLGSDAIALAPFTNRVCNLADGDWAIMRRDGAEIYTLGSGALVERPVETVDASAAMVDKGNYRHFMAKEIHEQPDVLSRTFGQYIDPEANGVLLPQNDLDFSKINRVILVACGTAYFAAQVGRNWIERYARIPASIDIASDFAIAMRQWMKTAWRCLCRNRAKRRIHWPRCTTAKHMACKQSVWSMCRKVPSPAKLT